jgi:hypothetical protein
MDDNIAIVTIRVVAIRSSVALIRSSRWLRSRSGQATAAGEAESVALLSNENEALRGQVGVLRERLEVLERIATDPATRTAHEIEQLR